MHTKQINLKIKSTIIMKIYSNKKATETRKNFMNKKSYTDFGDLFY